MISKTSLILQNWPCAGPQKQIHKISHRSFVFWALDIYRTAFSSKKYNIFFHQIEFEKPQFLVIPICRNGLNLPQSTNLNVFNMFFTFDFWRSQFFRLLRPCTWSVLKILKNQRRLAYRISKLLQNAIPDDVTATSTYIYLPNLSMLALEWIRCKSAFLLCFWPQRLQL